jgi:hypothetical protein
MNETVGMERRGDQAAEPSRAAGLAWVLFALGILATLSVLVLDYLDRSLIRSVDDAQPVGIVLGISFSILGAVIAVRQPSNRIGWIFLLIGVVTPLQALLVMYYERGVIAPGLPGARWSAWASNWATFPVFPTGLALFAFLLFPAGRLPSHRWKPVAWLAVVYAGVAILLAAVAPGKLVVGHGVPQVKNPLGVDVFGSNPTAITGVSYSVGIALIAVVVGGLLVRARRSSSLQERQQIKLLAYSATVTIALLIVLTAIYLAGLGVGNAFWDVPIVLGFGVAVPTACGVAILRHGLYDIDRLISRTVSYAILTGLLLAVFAAVVLLTTRLLPFTSSVGVALSTLVAAALFNPLRRRIQRAVDRRFNRAHYDAQSAVAALSSRLRNAVDSDTICSELLEAADHALAPSSASIWIKPNQSDAVRAR